MNYGKLLGRTWDLIWEHKFLILLGILVALGSSGSGTLSSGGRSLPQAGQEWRLPAPPGWRWPPGPLGPEFGTRVMPIVVALVLVGIALTIALVVWVVSTLARGALIAGASAADAGSVTNFGETFAVAWQKGWTLLGIGIFPAIPVLLLLLASLGAVVAYMGASPAIGRMGQFAAPRNVWIVLGALVCVALPFALILNLLRTFANRACMLEGCGVFDAYARGFSVLLENVGSTLILFLIQLGISIVLGLILLLPALCCLLWPFLLLVQGLFAAYFSTMWTLAWREWANQTPAAAQEAAT